MLHMPAFRLSFTTLRSVIRAALAWPAANATKADTAVLAMKFMGGIRWGDRSWGLCVPPAGAGLRSLPRII
ncbi:MAG: hypothetical protein CVU36_20780 [Betaproteobacteria bacterium HGW-Betaproteobacteria-9]|nr:MAG: hypothetical protein CVU36_20780 [Betaproteobacteria bacterium HGW-Betaproteobacteria-9]